MATCIWIGTTTAGDWSVAANWSGAAVPVDGDDVYLENSAVSVTAGLDQSAIALASLTIAQSYTGSIGTAAAYLQIGSVLTNIGQYFGISRPVGSPMIKLDLNDDVPTAGTINVYDSGSSSDSNVPTIRLLVNHATTVLNVYKGSVGVAPITGETSTIGYINVSYTTNVASDANVYVGSGVTLAALECFGGKTILNCASLSATIWAGTLTTNGTGAIGTINVWGGTVTSNSSGTITAANIKSPGFLDMTKSVTSRTITTLKRDNGGKFSYEIGDVTLTNGIAPIATSGRMEYK